MYLARRNYIVFLFTIVLSVLSYLYPNSVIRADLTVSAACNPVKINENFRKKSIGKHVEVLRDPDGILSYREVSSPPLSGKFKQHDESTFNHGIDTAVFWYRFTLQKTSKEESLGSLILVIPQTIKIIDLYVPVRRSNGKDVQRIQAGAYSFKENEYSDSSYPIMDLPDDVISDECIYARVDSRIDSYSMLLFSRDSFNTFIKFEYLVSGLITGILLAMMLYNLVLAVFLRDKAYAAYCIYIACINCYVSVYSGWLQGLNLLTVNMSEFILVFFSASYFFAMVFSRIFLDTPGKHRIMDRLFVGIMVLSVAVLVLNISGITNAANILAHLMGLAGPVVIMSCAAIRWGEGYRPALYYLVAWGFLYIASILTAAVGVGLLDYSYVIRTFALGTGAAFESIILSWALSDRIRSLREEGERLREKERRLTELSITDELTGLYNRRWFSSKIDSEMDHARRLGRPLSLVIVDIDHFKQFNDKYGHAQGDRVLAEMGKTIFDTVRLYDIPCRYGGEEFAIILPGANGNNGFAVAERLRKSFARKKIVVPGRSPIGATISIGVAQMGNEESADSFFQRADDALYRAKNGGRNKVVLAG